MSALLEAEPVAEAESAALVSPVALSDSQCSAAESALARRITAIQGPPGTGKSQTIVALVASAIAAGRSVIFVSRNHRALDEVEERVGDLFPGLPLVTRGRDADGTRNASLADALVALAQGGILAADEERRAARLRSDLLADTGTAARARAEAAARERLDLELSELVDCAAGLRDSQITGPAGRSVVARLRDALARLFRRGRRGDHGPVSLAALDARIVRLRRALATAPPPSEPPCSATITMRRARQSG